jgi:ribosomal protein S18 acetylase RimI-like enzyme
MKIRRWDGEEQLPWKLLLDADPSRREVRKYLSRGELWLLESGSEVLGAMVLMQTRVDVLEIMNIATDVSRRSKGLGTALLTKARQRARQLKVKTLHVGTGNTSFRQLEFYQRFGFRICGVDRDFFRGRYSSEYECGGVVLRDMVRMEMPV